MEDIHFVQKGLLLPHSVLEYERYFIYSTVSFLAASSATCLHWEIILANLWHVLCSSCSPWTSNVVRETRYPPNSSKILKHLRRRFTNSPIRFLSYNDGLPPKSWGLMKTNSSLVSYNVILLKIHDFNYHMVYSVLDCKFHPLIVYYKICLYYAGG